MFTGIIQSIGTIESLNHQQGDIALKVNVGNLEMSDVALGDSIAVNGVCLTAIEFDNHSFVADVSKETMSLTSLAHIKTGSSVNLEKALTLQTRLGGHLVSGHVDGLAEVISRQPDARSERFTFRAPQHLKKYIAAKGSVTLDGVSLTVNQVNDAEFDVNIVPHTQERTIIHQYQPGTPVNLEVDVIARYVERLVTAADSKPAGEEMTSDLNLEWLMEQGIYKA